MQADDFVEPPTVLSSGIHGRRGDVVAGRVHRGRRYLGKRSGSRAARQRPQWRLSESAVAVSRSKVGGMWSDDVAAARDLLVGLAIAFAAASRTAWFSRSTYTFFAAASPARRPSFVTSEFDLTGRTASARSWRSTRTSADNWAYFNFALINAATGDALRPRPRSQSHDRDSDGDEGSPSSAVPIPSGAARPATICASSRRWRPGLRASALKACREVTTWSIRSLAGTAARSYGWFWIAGSSAADSTRFSTRCGARSFEARRWALRATIRRFRPEEALRRMNHPGYWIYGMLLLTGVTVAELYRGRKLHPRRPGEERPCDGERRQSRRVSFPLWLLSTLRRRKMIMADFHPGYLLNALIYAALGIVIFLFCFMLIDKMTPYHLWKEIVEDKNIALAILIGAISLGMCVIDRGGGALALHPLADDAGSSLSLGLR